MVSGPVSAEELTLAFPASRDPELRAAQQVLVEAWGYVNLYYADPQFRGQSPAGWQQALQESLSASFKAPSPAGVYDIIDSMLSRLSDPYTRLVRPDQAPAVRAALDGRVTGLGLLAEPDTEGNVIVRFVADDSPAARAGIMTGDMLLQVNGRSAGGLSKQDLALLLANKAALELRRPASTSVAGGGSGGAPETMLQLTLQPEDMEVLPVQYALLQQGSTSTSAAATEEAGTGPSTAAPAAATLVPGIAYVRITTFSQNASREVEEALSSLLGSSDASSSRPEPGTSSSSSRKDVNTSNRGSSAMQAPALEQQQQQQQGLPEPPQPPSGLVLDLRDNGGGVLDAGYEVGQLLLRPGKVFCVVASRDGQEYEIAIEPPMDDGDDVSSSSGGGSRGARDSGRGSAIGIPMVVLVNGGSASASELLAGALHDSGGALLLGERTYGKGVTQAVATLSDSSLLFFTNALYVTPSRTPVQGVGLTPEVACSPESVERVYYKPGAEDTSLTQRLADDPCVQMALRELQQWPQHAQRAEQMQQQQQQQRRPAQVSVLADSRGLAKGARPAPPPGPAGSFAVLEKLEVQ